MRTEILDKDFLCSHHFDMSVNESLPVLQELLLLRIEETKPLWIPSSGSLCEVVFNILNSRLVCDFYAGGKFLDWLLRRWVRR